MKPLRVAVVLLPILLIAGAGPAFSSTAAPGGEVRVLGIAALPKNPVAYERQKAIANARYGRWAIRHGLPTAKLAPTDYTAVSNGLDEPGIHDDRYSPSDSTGAIGPSNYVELINAQLATFGSTDLSSGEDIDLGAFVGAPNGSVCDPQIQWDREGQRWLYAVLDCNEEPSTNSEKLYFGWSTGANPGGLWCQYQISTANVLEDYPKLGHDDTQIVIGTNGFDDGSRAYLGSHIFVLPKPAPGDTTCPTESTEVTSGLVTLDAPDAFTPVPANIADSSTNGYVVGIQNTNASSSSQLELYTITPTVTSGTISPTTVVTVPTYSAPAAVPQPGTREVLDSLDARLTQAVAVTDPNTSQEGIWTQHTIAGQSSGPSVVRWYELTPGATTPAQTGTVTAAGGAFAFDGAISPTADGHNAAIFYNSGSSRQLVDWRVQDRRSNTSTGTTIEDVQLATSGYVDADGTCDVLDGYPCRWGDYAAATPDPSNNCLVWGTGMLTTFSADGFGTPQWGTQNTAIDTCTPSYTLSVSTSGGGSGAVSSDVRGIACGPWCADSYATGTSVLLTATPGTHSEFAGWSGACSGDAASCTVTMNQARSVSANFIPEPEYLAVQGLGSGTVTSTPAGLSCAPGYSCEVPFDYGTRVTLSTTPSANYRFAGWSGDCSGAGTCTLTMTSQHSVTANFTYLTEHLTVIKAGTGAGTVTATNVGGIDCGPKCSIDVPIGSEVILAGSPDPGSVFSGWSGNCIGAGDGTCYATMNAAMSVTATFTKIVCVVPYVRGVQLSVAKGAIRDGRCSVGTIKKKKTSKLKKGKVISQSPAGGKHLVKGGRVNLVVSKGKPKK